MNADPPISGTRYQRFLHRQYRRYSGFAYRFRRRFTPGGYLVLFTALLCAALGVDTNRTVAYQAFTFLAFLIIFGLIGSRFSRSRFSAERTLPRFGSVGVPLTYSVVLRNPTARAQPSLALIEDLADPRPSLQEFLENPEPEEATRNWWDRHNLYYRWAWLISQNLRAGTEPRDVPTLSPRSQVQVRMEILPIRRGVLRFESLSVVCPDPTGLFRAFVKLPLPQSVLILPKRYPLPNIALPGTMKYQQGGVALASSVGESEEFVSLREYRPGDPLRHIHWKSWAKIGKPIVKEFQDEFFVRHALILDTFGTKAYDEVFEEAVSVAASFACTIQSQESLLDLMFVGPQAYCFTAGRGLAHSDQMLEILAAVQMCRHKPFSTLSNLVVEHVGAVSGCICIFVIWDEARQKLIRQLSALGLPLLVLVVVEAGKKSTIDPGASGASEFHVLEAGKVGEALARL